MSIVSNGWKDARNCLLVKVFAMSTRDAMFLTALDCEGEMKDGSLLANILIQAIEKIGPQNVVQVISKIVRLPNYRLRSTSKFQIHFLNTLCHLFTQPNAAKKWQ